MENKTAIESLIEKIQTLIDRSKISDTMLHSLVEEHLEMEKQQIIDSYKQGQIDSTPIRETDAEQYFNLIFNQPLNKSK